MAGNPPRSLDDTIEPDEPGTEESPTSSPSGDESPGDGDQDEGDEESEQAPSSNAATVPGGGWLTRLEDALSGHEVLALPYGDLDVSAAAERDPDAYTRARQRTGSTLEPWGFPTTPGISSPSGYVDPGALDTVQPGSTVLVTDRMFPDGAPPLARVDGRRLTPTSWSTEQGGPGPGDRLTAVAMRQRILAETAVRMLDPERPPLVVVMPQNWHPESTLGFFGGLDVDWLDLVGIGEISGRRGVEVDSESLTYPTTQVRHELDAANFVSASALAGVGETLQNVLTRNDTVAAAVNDESLTTLSYASRADPNTARANADRSRSWIASRLGSITVEAPRAVTLASSSGRFAATLTNRLDHPVTVSVESLADEPMTIDSPETIDIAAGSSTSVLLRGGDRPARRAQVQLVVTDEEGDPAGLLRPAADPVGPGEPGDLGDHRHRRGAAVRRDRRTPGPAVCGRRGRDRHSTDPVPT